MTDFKLSRTKCKNYIMEYKGEWHWADHVFDDLVDENTTLKARLAESEKLVAEFEQLINTFPLGYRECICRCDRFKIRCWECTRYSLLQKAKQNER